MLGIYFALIDDEREQIIFQEIYENYKKQMWYAANEILNDSCLAEDAVHDAFIGIAKNISKVITFDSEMIKPYVVTSARNSALNYIRKNKSTEFVDIQKLRNLQDKTASDKFNEVDTEIFAATILEKMPPLYSEVMYLYFVIKMTEKEIALQLNRNINTIRQQIFRGRKMFIDILERGEQIYDK